MQQASPKSILTIPQADNSKSRMQHQAAYAAAFNISLTGADDCRSDGGCKIQTNWMSTAEY